MNRIERVQATLARQPVDRVPVSAWGHFFTRERTAETFVAATREFVDAYDWDFLKIHPRACYHVEGWGFRYAPSTDPARDHICTGHPIDSIDAWRTLRPLPLDCPPLAEQLRAAEMLVHALGDRLPVIMTVFSPLDVAEKLVDRNTALLKSHLEQDPAALEPALASFAETFAAFVRRLVQIGVDGIYFSTQWASDSRMNAARYQAWVRPYDEIVLNETRTLWFNMLHLCGPQVQLDAMADYPVQAIHWDMHAAGNPSLADGKQRVRQAVGGGIDVARLATVPAEQVDALLVDCVRAADASGVLVGPGCSAEIGRTPAANFLAMRRASVHAAAP
jgi:uroporphyrinogen decarboxylase